MPTRRRRRATRLAGIAAIVLIVGCEEQMPTVEPEANVAPKTSGSISGSPWFVEAGADAGLSFSHDSGHREQYLMPEILAGGAALVDIDGDGDLDAYLIQSGRLGDPADTRLPNRLFRNGGDGRFEDVTVNSGADDRGYGMGVACGDIDNDGDVDLYVTNVGPNVLLRNDGTGRFTDVTASADVGDAGFGSSAAFLDYDNDGWLDLVVLNYLHWSIAGELKCYDNMGEPDYCSPQNYDAPARDVLYHNNGDGLFTEVTEQAGLDRAFGTGLGVVCGDFNADGWTDIVVANDGMPDQLWINQGDGTFRDEAAMAGCAVDLDGMAKAGMGVAAADLDDDGDLDLLICNLAQETDSLFRNDGGYFSDATALSGLGVISRPFTRFGVALIDFDNDGYLDLYQVNGRVMRQSTTYSDDPFAEPNLLYRGESSGRFEEISPRGGTTELLIATSRAAAFGDVDGDGGVDVLVVNRDAVAHLLMNAAPNRGHWISFRVMNENSSHALGATVALSVGDRRIRRDSRRAFSYLASNDPRVHVGLGQATEVTDVVVRWPNGAMESFGDFEADAVVTLQCGAGTLRGP